MNKEIVDPIKKIIKGLKKFESKIKSYIEIIGFTSVDNNKNWKENIKEIK